MPNVADRIKRTYWVNGKCISVTLERFLHQSLDEIAHADKRSANDIITSLHHSHGIQALPSAVRVYVVKWYREMLRRRTH